MIRNLFIDCVIAAASKFSKLDENGRDIIRNNAEASDANQCRCRKREPSCSGYMKTSETFDYRPLYTMARQSLYFIFLATLCVPCVLCG